MLQIFANVVRTYPAFFSVMCFVGALGTMLYDMQVHRTWLAAEARVVAVKPLCLMEATIFLTKTNTRVQRESVPCTDVEARQNERGDLTFTVTPAPEFVIHFTAFDGREHQFVAGLGSHGLTADTTENRAFGIQYLAADPAIIRHPMPSPGLGTPLCLALFGATLAGLAFFTRNQRRPTGGPSKAAHWSETVDLSQATPTQRPALRPATGRSSLRKPTVSTTATEVRRRPAPSASFTNPTLRKR